MISLPSFGSGETQVHCHQHAVLGWDADRRLLEGAGPAVVVLSDGFSCRTQILAAQSGARQVRSNERSQPGHLRKYLP
jgi:hypothetical protein